MEKTRRGVLYRWSRRTAQSVISSAGIRSDRESDKEDSQQARASLIEHNLRLVVYIAQKFDTPVLEWKDLISIGTIGLIKAINTFNPETVIVGGELAEAGDYLMLPLKSATNKYSLNLVYKDTKFRLSKMGKTASAWGAAMLIRNQVLGLC